jgi:hypothetical protein
MQTFNLNVSTHTLKLACPQSCKGMTLWSSACAAARAAHCLCNAHNSRTVPCAVLHQDSSRILKSNPHPVWYPSAGTVSHQLEVRVAAGD